MQRIYPQSRASCLCPWCLLKRSVFKAFKRGWWVIYKNTTCIQFSSKGGVMDPKAPWVGLCNNQGEEIEKRNIQLLPCNVLRWSITFFKLAIWILFTKEIFHKIAVSSFSPKTTFRTWQISHFERVASEASSFMKSRNSVKYSDLGKFFAASIFTTLFQWKFSPQINTYLHAQHFHTKRYLQK